MSNGDMVAGAVALAFTLILVVVVALLTIRFLVVILPPNKVAVLTGRSHTLLGGETVGYRTMIGGRTLRVPLIESVQSLSLELFPVEFSVPDAVTRSNTSLAIEGAASVKIASEPQPVLGNAVERFLGKSEGEIVAAATTTLQGAVRTTVATLLPGEAKKDPSGFAATLTSDARIAAAAQGLHLDVLEIRRVTEEGFATG